jgi:hypothetical protein
MKLFFLLILNMSINFNQQRCVIFAISHSLLVHSSQEQQKNVVIITAGNSVTTSSYTSSCFFSLLSYLFTHLLALSFFSLSHFIFVRRVEKKSTKRERKK